MDQTEQSHTFRDVDLETEEAQACSRAAQMSSQLIIFRREAAPAHAVREGDGGRTHNVWQVLALCIVDGRRALQGYQPILASPQRPDPFDLPQKYDPTIFDNYSICYSHKGKKFNMGIWDTSGSDDYNVQPLPHCFSSSDVHTSLLTLHSD